MRVENSGLRLISPCLVHLERFHLLHESTRRYFGMHRGVAARPCCGLLFHDALF
jgi:hypothetical protein